MIDRLRARLGIEPPDPHEAEHTAAGAVPGQRVVAVGYHGLPLLKRAPWKPHIAVYFFLSGLAGSAYLLATVAEWLGGDEDREVVVWGRRLALAGIAAGTPLLIDDLKRPERFLHMLRIVKPRSPMSMGAWALTFLGGFAGLGVLPLPVGLGRGLGLLGAPFAAFVASYTGVLLAATAVPLWARARLYLGPLFFCSGLSGGLAALGLLVRNEPARGRLRDLELLALAAELVAVSGMVRALGPFGRPLVARPFGAIFWGGSVAAGQVVPLLLHGRHLVRGGRPGPIDTFASILVLAGGLMTRFAIVEAGKLSADDPQAAFLYHR